MIDIKFSKSRAEYFLDCLARGEPIGRVECLHQDLLALAGACLSLATTCPDMYGEKDLTALPAEFQDAIVHWGREDAVFAIRFLSHLTDLVRFGQFDEQYPAECRWQVQSIDGGRVLVPLNADHTHREAREPGATIEPANGTISAGENATARSAAAAKGA